MGAEMRLTILLAFAALRLGAHHGATGFDGTEPVHVMGKVTSADWANPHVVIHVNAAGVEWQVVTVPPAKAQRLGFTQASLVGAEVIVDGHQASDGTNRVNAVRIAFPDGKAITHADCFVTPQNCFSPRGASDR